MQGKNPFSFVIGFAILIITAAAVIRLFTGTQPPGAVVQQQARQARQPAAARTEQPRVPPAAALPQQSAVPRPAPAAIEPRPALFQGTIAIVLDDWGYTTGNVAALKEIPFPVTAAVLPNLKYSATVAEELSNAGKEIILHLPMQPMEKTGLEPDTITAEMDDKKIRAVVGRALENVRYARGINNHMGSRATQDRRVMNIVIAELKNRGLFYLDSYTVASSVGPDTAGELGVPYAKRDVFLDNKLDPESIKAQLNVLKEKAKKHGFAIGIGHDRKATLAVLREMMPKMAAEGYRFVPVSELARHKE